MAFKSGIDAGRRSVGMGVGGGYGHRVSGRSCSGDVSRRVVAAGVDTWSLCWYAEPGSPLHCALRALATQQAGRAELLPERVKGHRVGWFPDHGLVFVEGHPGEGGLCRGVALRASAVLLVDELRALGVPVGEIVDARVRRLDVAVDLRMQSGVEGLAFLECVGGANSASGKTVTYRVGRVVQSVVLKSPAGCSQARLYDKGAEQGVVESGRWLRLEGQWRFGRDHRLAPEDLAGEVLRRRFCSRFSGLMSAVDGLEVGGVDVLADRLRVEIETGRLSASRARSVAGYLLLSAVGAPQGARRTRCELERDCRELGLSLSLANASGAGRVGVATILGECASPGVWA